MITGLLIGAGVTTVVMELINFKREHHNRFYKFFWSTLSNFVMSAAFFHALFYMFFPYAMLPCIIAAIFSAILFIFYNFA
jgi:hypothetical protein